MGCAGSRDEDPEPEDEEGNAIEEKINERTQYYEEHIEPLRVELQKHKEQYQVMLADTINKRMPQQLGGLGTASRKPVDLATQKIQEVEQEIKRLQGRMREDISDLRAEQRQVIAQKQEPAAKLESSTASSSRI